MGLEKWPGAKFGESLEGHVEEFGLILGVSGKPEGLKGKEGCAGTVFF